jgi:hypothetical protein
VNSVPNGRYRSRLLNGVCLREASVKDGQWHGTMTVRRSDGVVLDVSEFENGTEVYRIFTADGRLTDQIPLRRGKSVVRYFIDGWCTGAVRKGRPPPFRPLIVGV